MQEKQRVTNTKKYLLHMSGCSLPILPFCLKNGFLVLRIVLWCRYCLMSFPFSVTRHLQIVPVHIHQETTEILFNF